MSVIILTLVTVSLVLSFGYIFRVMEVVVPGEVIWIKSFFLMSRRNVSVIAM